MGLCKVGGARRLLKHRLIRKFIILFPVVQEGAFLSNIQCVVPDKNFSRSWGSFCCSEKEKNHAD